MKVYKSIKKNKSSSKITMSSIVFGVYYGLPFILISILIHINPSGAPPPTPFESIHEALITGLRLFLPFAAGIIILMNLKNKKLFVFLFVFLMLTGIAVCIMFSVKIHRDYLTIPFQILFNHLIIAVLRADFFVNRHVTRSFSQPFITAVLIVLLIFSLWILLVGYNINTRTDPRWFESIFSNIYNCIIIFILLLSILQLRGRLYKKIEVTQSSLIVDGYDLTRLINSTNLLILYHIISLDRERVTCSVLDPLIFGNEEKNDSTVKKWTCEECLENSYKATHCPRYKTIYNGILELKKTLETFELGTILPPENRKNILTEGWKILFFEGVRVKIKKNRQPSAMPAGK